MSSPMLRLFVWVCPADYQGVAMRAADVRSHPSAIVSRGCSQLFVLGLLILLLHPSIIFAHAVPRATRPAANAVLHEAPREITIRFSERVEARASSLQVLDAHGIRIDEGKATIASEDPWLYRLVLPPLGAGVYTVSWRVMSADDGHVTDGAYVFVVGEAGISPAAAADQVIAVTGWFDA